MKKVIFSMVLSLSSVLVFTSCSTGPSSPEEKSGQITLGHLSNKSIQDKILQAGQENHWIMTKFKSNSIIAEKITDNDSISTTVTFDKSSFNLYPQNSELRDILNDALN